MKALITNSSTTVTWWLRRGRIGLAVLFMVVLLGFGLAGVLYLSGSAQKSIPASPVDLYSPLDQHERHPTGFSNGFKPLDQHERHPAGFLNTYLPLDQHERHLDGFPKNDGPSDAHAIGATIATQGVPDAATQGTLDYLRVHSTVSASAPQAVPDAATQGVMDYLRAHGK